MPITAPKTLESESARRRLRTIAALAHISLTKRFDIAEDLVEHGVDLIQIAKWLGGNLHDRARLGADAANARSQSRGRMKRAKVMSDAHDTRIDVRTLGWNLVSKAKYLQIASGKLNRVVHVTVGMADIGIFASTGSYTTSQKTVIERVVQERTKIARERVQEALGRRYKPGMRLSPAEREVFRKTIHDSIDRVDLLDIGESGGEKGYLIVDGHHTLAAHQHLGLPIRALVYAPWRPGLGARFLLRAPTDERF